MRFSVEMSGYCLVSKKVYNNEEPVKWIARREVKLDQQTGWFFLSHPDRLKGKKGKLSMDDFVSVPYGEFASGKKKFFALIYNMPMGTDLQIVFQGEKIYLHDNNARKLIDLEKYLTLPLGSPLSMAHIEKKSLWSRLFGGKNEI